MSGVFWGFDPRAFDLITPDGFKAYKFTNGVLTPPLTLIQAGWIRGFTPPPAVDFSYVDSVGCKLIKSATLLIGGQTIDRLTSERLIIEDDLEVPYENQTGLAILEGKGDTSQIYAPREYYTRLTFNMNKLNMKALTNQDVQINIEYDKFENLPTQLITTQGLTDGGSYVNTNIKTLLGIDETTRVFFTLFYKKYIIYGIDPDIYYFYDTTKPIGNVSSWILTRATMSAIRPYVIGGTLYIANDRITSFNVDDMIATGYGVPMVGSVMFPGLYEGQLAIDFMTADARYLYIDVRSQIVTFGSNTAYLSSLTPPGYISLEGYGNQLTLAYNVLSISTPQLIPSDNVALVNFVTTQSAGIAFDVGSGDPVSPSSITITGQTKISTTITATVRIQYPMGVAIRALPGFYINTTTTLSGSNVATFLSCTPECAFANTVATYTVYNISTPQLIPSDNAAVINYLTTWTPDYDDSEKTVTITSETKVGSDILVTANVAYTYTSNGQPAVHTVQNPIYGPRTGPGNHITVRYDTTKPIGAWSSYDYLTYPGTGAPRTWLDITNGIYEEYDIPLTLLFDGRNVYGSIGGRNIFTKIDTQDFLNLSSYTYFDVGSLSFDPARNPVMRGTFANQIPNATDGRYVYFQTNGFSGGSVYLTRYDSTQSISSPDAYSSFLFTCPSFPDGYGFNPFGFDGKSIYYTGGTYIIGVYKVFSSIVRYDTTTNSVSDWIIFDGTGKAQTSSNTTVDTISWAGSYYFIPGVPAGPSAAALSCLVSARYVYLTETYGGSQDTFNDFVQFDPLNMFGTLKSSMLVKYETYDVPKPLRAQSLYGQTVTNEFTIPQGQTFGSFKLGVQGPVREFWVTVDSPGVIDHILFRLNNEVLVDDDHVMTRYIRTFETHTSMPSSSNVCVYSVSWNPEDLVPSGTINMSRIADQFIDVTLVAQAPSNLMVRVYSKTFNILATQGGLGGLLFNFSL